MGIWLLVTFHFQPSLLASKLQAAPRKGDQSVNLSLSVNSPSTASPMQCLLKAAGVTGCHEAPTLNLQVQLLYNPMVEQVEEEETPNGCESRWGCTRLSQPNGGSGGRGENSQQLWQRMRSALVISQKWIRQKRRLPTAVKAEEDIHKYIYTWPNGGTGRRGESSQWLWRWTRSYKVPMRRKALWTNLDKTDPSALAGNWSRRDNSDQKHQSFEVGRY